MKNLLMTTSSRENGIVMTEFHVSAALLVVRASLTKKGLGVCGPFSAGASWNCIPWRFNQEIL
jgi:hypothetical protein